MDENNNSLISIAKLPLRPCKYSIRCRGSSPSVLGSYVVRRYSFWRLGPSDDGMANNSYTARDIFGRKGKGDEMVG